LYFEQNPSQIKSYLVTGRIVEGSATGRPVSVLHNYARLCIRHGGALVGSMILSRRVVDSTPALAAM